MSNRVVIQLQKSSRTPGQLEFRDNFAFDCPHDLELTSPLQFLKSGFVPPSAIPQGEDREVSLPANRVDQFKQAARALSNHLRSHDLCVTGSEGVHILSLREDGAAMRLRIEPSVPRRQPPALSAALPAPGGVQAPTAGPVKREREADDSAGGRLPPHLREEGWPGSSGGAGSSGGRPSRPPPPPPGPPAVPPPARLPPPSRQMATSKGTKGRPLPNVVANFALVKQTKVRVPPWATLFIKDWSAI
jgi:hypothetical protein